MEKDFWMFLKIFKINVGDVWKEDRDEYVEIWDWRD